MGSIYGVYAAAALFAASPALPAGPGDMIDQSQTETYESQVLDTLLQEATFDAEKFKLPNEAKVLVVVEGTTGTECNVYAYEKVGDSWKNRLSGKGYLGQNGMSNHRVMGDKTTPIGVFQMNTPFGQKPALEGFPKNYIQVDTSYVWSDQTNSLCQDLSQEGERVGSAGYAGYYDYVIDAGFNKNAVEKKGSALFLHCEGEFKAWTSGCVAIEKEKMIEIMRLYGTYGDGSCYIAQAPAGTFDFIYDSYGANNGLSPDGDF
ncbi:L,D-transpeptidase family protein [Lachnoclostridium edouardi]|uniref:L,D-transpeptidase family protein n=1 Tax=Lachnoclostridium edouardi TaxID=1926283 RepID=UPI000C7A3577|nr:L,D-transpeptidase family protein [Lachnoclostridium edouardi]